MVAAFCARDEMKAERGRRTPYRISNRKTEKIRNSPQTVMNPLESNFLIVIKLAFSARRTRQFRIGSPVIRILPKLFRITADSSSNRHKTVDRRGLRR